LALSGWGLADLWRAQASARAASALGTADNDPAVIFLWLPGGPPHMETFDMKPDAPEEYRGIFKPIHTNVPGIDICEHMPKLARLADKYTLIRSIAHTFSDHGGGHKRFMTARDPKQPDGFVNDTPAVGSLISRVLKERGAATSAAGGLPNYICGVERGRQGIDTFSLGTAYLGPAWGPFFVPGDPSESNFQVENLSLAANMENRLADRTELLAGFDQLRRQVDATGRMSATDTFHRQAMELLLSPAARQAFDLQQEPLAVRQRYGQHAWGYRALMARRLVEAGCPLVTMILENPYVSGRSMRYNGTYNWDSHAVNCHLFEDGLVRIPLLDHVVATLIEDLYARGLDRRVLLVVTGEFGRTPRISQSVGTQTGVLQPGRDHWPQAMSVLVSGGGLPMGQVIGSTNKKGEHPHDRPLTPNDLWATMLRHLNIDPQHAFLDHHGRPMPILPYGEPIRELASRGIRKAEFRRRMEGRQSPLHKPQASSHKPQVTSHEPRATSHEPNFDHVRQSH
jgi:hypothetical protein